MPSAFTTDPAHDRRWTSLRDGHREWLRHRPDLARQRVAPGDAFVDAGGLEECVLTVRGVDESRARVYSATDGKPNSGPGQAFHPEAAKDAGRSMTGQYRQGAALAAEPGAWGDCAEPVVPVSARRSKES
ncbi:hypothetical protein [Streptomyces griseorubiginosus]|uniref:hypothetical protein n=1 Tax=Streptomyces griseorubiginosus TaxID=67304 RepID=UPI00365321EC